MQLLSPSFVVSLVEKKKAVASVIALFLGGCYREEESDNSCCCLFCGRCYKEEKKGEVNYHHLLLGGVGKIVAIAFWGGCYREKEGDNNFHCLIVHGVL